MNIDLCQHDAAGLIEILMTEIQSLKESVADWAELTANNATARDEGLAREAELHAEIAGMNAGARLDAATPYEPGSLPIYTTMANNLSDAMNTWIGQIELLITKADGTQTLDRQTVIENLLPFINTVESWKDSIDAITNPTSTEEN